MSGIDWREAIAIAVKSRNGVLLSTTLLTVVLSGDATAEEADAEARAALDRADPETRAYWQSDCDCADTTPRHYFTHLN